MKHLFVYILCALMCCGTYAQSVKNSPPPMGVKLTTKKAAEARQRGKAVKAGVLQKQEKAAKAVRSKDGKLRKAGKRVGRPMRVAARKVPAAAPVAADMARITVNVESDWGDGSGYQLLLDADCEFANLEYVEDLFTAAEYVLPENAAVLENWLVAGQTASVDIPAGTYDYWIFNPTPPDSYYTAGGESTGYAYDFKGGVEYVFTITLGGEGDNVELTADSPVSIGVTGITAPVSAEGLTAAEAVTATIANKGTEAVSSFTATLTVDGGTPVTETVNQEIQPGETYDYTFTATADLSAPGMHTVTVAIACDGDALTGDNTVTTKVNHIAPIAAPYTCSFDEEADIDEWNIIDANKDGETWQIQTDYGYAQVIYSAYFDTDDYLVTMNPISLEAGANKIVVGYNAQGEGYYESFEVIYGKTSNVNEMTVLRAVPEFTATADGYILPVNFDLEEAGAYYFAIHGTSPADQLGLLINDVEISAGAYTGTPDLSVDRVILPLSSCSLGNAETVSAVISNNGTADVTGFTVECLVDGNVHATTPMATAITAGESVTVEISTNVDLSAEGVHTVGVRITDVTPADGQNDETVTDNNSAEATVTHYTPADVPFTVDFEDPTQRGDWASDGSWLYDGEYYPAMYCVGTTPLVSRGINLEAGKRYRISYNYMAGMYYFFFTIYESYDVIIGKDGAPLEDWNVIESFSDIYTNDVFTDNSLTFTVPENGVYSLGFIQDVPQGTLYLDNVSVTEVVPYDITVTGVTGLPSQLPMEQAEGMALTVPVKNNGAQAVSGTVSVTFNGNAAGSATFTDLAPDATATVSVPVTAQGLATGSVSVAVEAVIDGQTDGNQADNSFTASMEITEEVYAYDHMTDDLYIEDNGIGIEGGGNVTAGIPFLINAKTTLKGVSVGWGVADGQQISLSVYKWDPTNLYQDGVVIVGDKVYTTTADQGTTVGQIDYMFDEVVTLEPGYYFIGVTYVGHALVVDGVAPGQLYLIDSETLGYPVAVDNSSLGFGTPPVRAILGGDPSGIGSVEVGAGASGIVYNESSKTLVATSSAGDISSLAVYSASGAQVGNVAGGAGECVFDASRLVPGVYVAKMTTADGTETSKFIVK